MGQTLSERSVEAKQIDKFCDLLSYYDGVCRASDVKGCKWIAHGHLGLSVLWSGIAATLNFSGLDNRNAVERISHGELDTKLRIAADEWSQSATLGNLESPEAFIRWLKQGDKNQA
jgi:hypothetical protein